MNMEEFVQSLADRGVTVELSEGRVRVRNDPGGFTPEIEARIKASRGELIEWLEAVEDWARFRAEIEAIEASGVPRAEAIRRAYRDRYRVDLGDIDAKSTQALLRVMLMTDAPRVEIEF